MESVTCDTQLGIMVTAACWLVGVCNEIMMRLVAGLCWCWLSRARADELSPRQQQPPLSQQELWPPTCGLMPTRCREAELRLYQRLSTVAGSWQSLACVLASTIARQFWWDVCKLGSAGGVKIKTFLEFPQGFGLRIKGSNRNLRFSFRG